MKKVKIILPLILISALFLLFSNVGSPNIIAKEDKVDKEVKDLLKTQAKVRVIVALNSEEDYKNKPKKKSKEQLEKDKEKNKQIEDEVLSRLNKNDFEVIYQYDYIPGFAGFVSQEGLYKLENNSIVARVAIDGKLYEQLAEAGPLINSPATHTAGYDGTGQTVCVLDSGVNYNHDNLGGGGFPNAKIIGGYDYVNTDTDPIDDQHHGTYVSGIVSADNTNSNIYLGIAPDSDVVAMKVLDAGGSASISAVQAAIDDCIDLRDVHNIVALNMSIGDNAQWNNSTACETYSDVGIDYNPMSELITAAKDAGIAIFAASGNQSYSDGINYPACHSDVISVGSVNDISPYAVVNSSNSDELLDVLAPGSSIISTYYSSFDYAGRSGTSYASPMAAGAAALMMDENNSLTPEQIRCALVETGIDTPDTGTGPIKPRIDISAAITFDPTITGNTVWTGGYNLYKNISTIVTSGSTVPMGEDLLIKDGSDNILAAVDVDCNANLGTDVSMGQDFGNFKAFVHNLASKTSVGNVSLYIPKGAGHNSVWMCPGASSLSEVNAGCAGGFTLSGSNPNNGSYHLVISDPNYWIVEGIENTGGFSQQEETSSVPQLPAGLLWKILLSLISLAAVVSIAAVLKKRGKKSKKKKNTNKKNEA